MKVRALRGVCIGVDRNLVPEDTADLDAATVAFLVGIGAVERVPDEPAPAPPAAMPAHAETDDSDSKSKPGKSGKKEK